MTNRDRAIIATLTTKPQYIPEWDEYAAIDNNGVLHAAETSRQCAARVQESNEYIARHARVNVAWDVLAEMQAE